MDSSQSNTSHSNNSLAKKDQRIAFLDFTRGIAIGLMLIFHFCFGLAQLGLIKANFSADLLWISFRVVIVFLFLSLVGVGLYLATRENLNLKSYFKRLGLLLVYLTAISLLSFAVRPTHYVFFGILHLIFVSSILGLIFVRFYWANLVLAFGALIAGLFLKFNTLSQSEYLWLGMSKLNRSTDDYAPLIPWFGFVLIGIFIGKTLFEKRPLPWINQWQAENWVNRLICWTGRQSIHIYFIHFQFFYLLVYWFG